MIIGEIEIRGVKVEFNEQQQPMETVKGLLVEGYKLVEPSKDRVGEYKAPLNFKGNIELDGVKYTKGVEIIGALVEKGLLSKEDLLPHFVIAGTNKNEKAEALCGQPNSEIDFNTRGHTPEQYRSAMRAVLTLKSIEGTLKDGGIIKSFKNGMIRVGDKKLDADDALELLVFHANHHNIDELNGVLMLNMVDPAGDVMNEHPLFKFNSVEDLNALLYLIHGRGKAEVTEFVDAHKLISRLTNVRSQDLVGLVVMDATIIVTLGSSVAVFTAQDNEFRAEAVTDWDIDIDFDKANNFKEWYNTIKALHGANAKVKVVGGAINCYDRDEESEVSFDTIAEVRAEGVKRYNRIIEDTESELLEIADNLEDLATRIREIVMPTQETEE